MEQVGFKCHCKASTTARTCMVSILYVSHAEEVNPAKAKVEFITKNITSQCC